MNLQQLQFFLVSARKGSLTRAAEELYTTQPHVSQVIRSLEGELGVALFHRTGSGITLTRQGEEIRYYAENTLKNASLIQDICQENADKTLKIAVNSSSRLAYLCEDYYLDQAGKNLSLQYTECGIEEMLHLIQDQNYDLGFLFVPTSKRSAFEHMIRRRNMEYTQILASDLVVHSGPLSPFYNKPLIRPEDLDQCSCIQMEDDFFSVDDLLSHHKAYRTGKCRIRKVIRTNSDHLMLRMLQRTSLCNVGSYWIRDDGEEEQFSISVIDGFQGMVSFGCLTLAGKKQSAEAQAFLARLKKRIYL